MTMGATTPDAAAAPSDVDTGCPRALTSRAAHQPHPVGRGCWDTRFTAMPRARACARCHVDRGSMCFAAPMPPGSRLQDAGVETIAAALGRSHRADPVAPRTGGPAGNARLTA